MKRELAALLSAAALAAALSACGGGSTAPHREGLSSSGGSSSGGSSSSGIAYCGEARYNEASSFCDARDHRTYRWVKIGRLVWMAENLNFGTMVEGAVEQNGSDETASDKWCYNDTASYCTKYGALYQWHTAMGFPPDLDDGDASAEIRKPHRGICPEGWHVPSASDWADLEDQADKITRDVKDDEAKYLKSRTDWIDETDPGIDRLGFNALPSGARQRDGTFFGLGKLCHWWSAAEESATRSRDRMLYRNSAKMSTGTELRVMGFSLRCVKDY